MSSCYIREKNPQDVAEACNLYERYTALTGEDGSSRRTGVRGVNDPLPPPSVDTAALQRQVAEAVQKATATTNQQLQELTDAVAQLHTPAAAAASTPASSQPRAAETRPPPRKPCPRCGLPGHWARDCTQGQHQPTHTDACYRCGQPGHRKYQCTAPLNAYGPTLAPSVGPRPPRQP